MAAGRFDVLGLGVVSVDEFLYVDRYPGADDKEEVRRHERRIGGIAGNALIAAARLGARCGYAGVLGTGELDAFVRRQLDAEGIDSSHAITLDTSRPIHSHIIVDQRKKTRAIFFNPQGAIGLAADRLPSRDVLASAKVILLDHFGADGMLEVARFAREQGIPTVGDIEWDHMAAFGELMALISHLILSERFALRVSGASTPAEAVAALWHPGRKCVAVTCGGRGCWFRDGEETGLPRHHPATPVEARDTTGCGDVFHGAYAAALAAGRSVADCIAIAASCAADKATQDERGRWEISAGTRSLQISAK